MKDKKYEANHWIHRAEPELQVDPPGRWPIVAPDSPTVPQTPAERAVRRRAERRAAVRKYNKKGPPPLDEPLRIEFVLVSRWFLVRFLGKRVFVMDWGQLFHT
jgi:hypothetical protein